MFCGNDKVYDGMLMSLISITNHTSDALNVYIITADLQDVKPEYKPITLKHKNRLEKLVREKNPDSKVTVVDASTLFRDEMMDGKNLKTHYTPYIFLRLYADKLEELPEKILYLDTDIICYRDLNELYNTDISKVEYAAAIDYFGKWFIDYKYINSGVLLMNLKLLKEADTLSKCRKMCVEKKMLLPDQTALNKCSKNKMYLPRKFNEQKERKEDTVLRHFSMTMKFFPYFKTINIKPWDITNIHEVYNIHDFDDVIEKYENIKSAPDLEAQNINV